MISWRHLHNLLTKVDSAHMRLIEWSGKTVGDLAPDNAVVCVVNGSVARPGDDLWIDTPPDGSSLCYVTTETDPITFIAIAYYVTVLIIAAKSSGLFSPSSIGIESIPDDQSEETFSFDSIRTLVKAGSTIPVDYGHTLVGGQLIMAYRTTSGANVFLNILLALGEGPIQSIGQYDSMQLGLSGANLPQGMLINGNEASDFQHLTVSFLLGKKDEYTDAAGKLRPLPGFEWPTKEYAQDYHIEGDQQAFVYFTVEPVQHIRILFQHPQGLFDLSDQGWIEGQEVHTSVKVYSEDGLTLVRTHNQSYWGQVRGYGLSWQADVADLPLAKYRVEVRKHGKDIWSEGRRGSDFLKIIAVQEIIYLRIQHQGLALVAVRVRAQERIHGDTPNIALQILGKRVRTPDSTDDTEAQKKYSRSPAWIAADILTDPRYALGHSFEWADVDSASFQAFDDHCNTVILPSADATLQDDIQKIKYEGVTGGTFILVLEADKTSTIAWDASAATVQTSIEALTAIGSGNVGVTSPAAGEYVITGQGTLADTHIEPFWIDGSALTGTGPLNKATRMAVTKTQKGTKEVRFRFDHEFGRSRKAWEQLLKVGASARTSFIITGNRVKAKVEKTQVSAQTFTMGDEENFSTTYFRRSDRPNFIEATYRNRETQWRRDQVVVNVTGLDEDDSGPFTIRKQTQELFGVQRPTQALRLAAALLRVDLYIRATHEWTSPVDAITIEPGDVVAISHEALERSISGRLVGTSGGNVQMDQSFAFLADRRYSYEESDKNDATSTKHFEHTGTTDVLPFPPQFSPSSEAIGRRYVLGHELTLKHKVLVTKITADQDGLKRRIEAIDYVAAVYSDDAEALGPGLFSPRVDFTPIAVTGLTASEASFDAGTSFITVSWTGALDADHYDVWVQDLTGGIEYTPPTTIPDPTPDPSDPTPAEEYDHVATTQGVTTSFSIAINFEAVIKIKVQTVMPDGQKNALASAPSYTLTIAREDIDDDGYGGTDLITLPADVANLALATIDDNRSTLSWDAVAGAELYRVRVGGWLSGITIHETNVTSLEVRLDRTIHRFHVRALKDGHYSELDASIDSTVVGMAAYPTVLLTDDLELRSQSGRRDTGPMSPVLWIDSKYALLQNAGRDREGPHFTLATYDLEEDSEFHVSVDFRIKPFSDIAPGDEGLAASAKTRTIDGLRIRRLNHLTYELRMFYSSDKVAWDSIPLAGLTDHGNNLVGVSWINSNIIKTARYFRFQFSGQPNPTIFLDPNARAQFQVRVLVERFKVVFAKA